MLVGLLVLLLPVVVTLVRDRQLDETARRYGAALASVEPRERLAAERAAADRYNTDLATMGHHAMPPQPQAPGMEDYLARLALPETAGAMARIVIPTIKVDLPIYHTTRSDVLHRGAGHMFGTDLPVGGDGRTAVVSAHTGMVDATMFDNLPRLREGDDVLLQILGETHVYRVRNREVVKPDDTSKITYETGVDKLVLITCTPYGINSDRLLVEAVRVPGDRTAQTIPSWQPRLSWWMIADLLVVGVVLLLIARREWRGARARRKAAAGAAQEGSPAQP